MDHNKLGLTIGAGAGAAFVFANVGSFAAPIALAARGLAALALIVTIAVVWRGAEAAGDYVFRDRGGHALLIVVVVEAVVAAVGLKLLNGALDTPGAGVAWIATVVGVHFFALASLWGLPRVNWLAAAVTGCGLTGCVLAFAGAGQASVDAVAGVLTGAVLLGFSGAVGVHRSGDQLRVS